MYNTIQYIQYSVHSVPEQLCPGACACSPRAAILGGTMTCIVLVHMCVFAHRNDKLEGPSLETKVNDRFIGWIPSRYVSSLSPPPPPPQLPKFSSLLEDLRIVQTGWCSATNVHRCVTY